MKYILSGIGLLWALRLTAQDAVPAVDIPDPGPIMVPEPVPYSFDTPGWYIVACLLIISFAFYSIKWIIRYRKNAYRRKAIARIVQLNEQVGVSSGSQVLSQAMVVLKQVALHAYGREKVASLSGKEWINYLGSTAKDTPFEKYESTINEAVYKDMPVEQVQLGELLTLSLKWIKTHA